MRSFVSGLKLGVSSVALVSLLAMPTLAQQSPATPTPGLTRDSTTVVPGTGIQSTKVGKDQLKESLKKAGIEDTSEIKGQVVQARTAEGHPIMILLGPEGFEKSDDEKTFNQDRLRGDLTRAGLSNIEFAGDEVVRGKLDDKAVLAVSAGAGARDSTARQDTPSADLLEKSLGNVFQDRKTFRGQVVKAQAEGGGNVLMIVGSETFDGDEGVDLSAVEFDKMRQSGLQGAEMMRDVEMLRGKVGDHAALALAGKPLEDTGSAATGANPKR